MPLYRLPNIPGFLAFRVFFNARFYYPVFALLFLDFGLTLSEFSISNLIWAVAIVTLEVPSGALADVVGRKKADEKGNNIIVLDDAETSRWKQAAASVVDMTAARTAAIASPRIAAGN